MKIEFDKIESLYAIYIKFQCDINDINSLDKVGGITQTFTYPALMLHYNKDLDDKTIEYTYKCIVSADEFIPTILNLHQWMNDWKRVLEFRCEINANL